MTIMADRTPPNVRMSPGAGARCPVDDVVLVLDQPAGWFCPDCCGSWDLRGRNGVWLAAGRSRDDVAPSAMSRLAERLLATKALTGRWTPGGMTVAAGEALAGWLDRVVTRYPAGELIPDEDLDPETLALLHQIRAEHRARGEVV
jgi:hypothetical protein